MDNKITQTLNVNRYTNGGPKNMDKETKVFQDYVDNLVDNFLDKRIQEVPPYGDFAPVTESFKNPSNKTKAGAYGIRVYKLPKEVDEDPKKRMVDAVIYLPASDYTVSSTIAYGTVDDIVKQFKNPEFKKNLNYKFGDLLEQLDDI